MDPNNNIYRINDLQIPKMGSMFLNSLVKQITPAYNYQLLQADEYY